MIHTNRPSQRHQTQLHQLEALDARVLLSKAATAAVSDYLSDLSPTVVSNGYGPISLDQSNGEANSGDGRQIKINGTRYTKGVGVHADSELYLELGGKYRSFVSDVGVDDEVGRAGTVDFQVWADGEEMFDSGTMTGVTNAKRVNVDVSGKNELKLIVTDAGDGNTFDHADWAGARLIEPTGPAPVLALSGDVTLTEPQSSLFEVASFDDAATNPTYSASVDWGDGTGRHKLAVDTTDHTLTLDHDFDLTKPGDYTVTVRLSNGGATTVGSFKTTVVNVAPSNVGLVGAASDGSFHEISGFGFTGNGIFTDPGEFGGEVHTASIDYGDGTAAATVPVTGRFFSVSHVYAHAGTYTLTSSITDSAGNVGTGTNTIIVSDPSYTYLSDLTTSSASGTVNDDVAADGSALSINGANYTKGLGVTADSDLHFALGGNYLHLVGDVGVDDSAGSGASVDFQIFADNQLIFDSGMMTSNSAAKRINRSLRNVNDLQLLVTHAGTGSATIADAADWAGIRLT